MSNSHDIDTVDKTNRSSQINNVCIYKGGKVDEREKRKVECVQIHESVSVIDDEAFRGQWDESNNLRTIEFSKNKNNQVPLKQIGNKSFCVCE